ncbi:MAG: ATP-binding cassette domain-containing protein [Verrucomicrobiia bacterium]
MRRSGRSKQIERLLEFARLTPFKKRLAGHLSGGMKQKLGLVCALVHEPRVLLLDEPTNGLDPVSRREFWGLLQPLLARGVTILMSTAYLDEAERFCRLALMHKGRIVTVGAPSAVKEFARGAIVEIQSSRARHVAGVVQELVPGCQARLVGENVRVWMPTGVELRDRIERALADAGVSVGSISEVEPSVEDVFVAVLGEGHRDELQEPSDESDLRIR